MRHFVIILLMLPAAGELAAQPLFPMAQADQWGFIDEAGEWVIDPAYGWATTFHEGLAAVTQDGVCWWFIDTAGQRAFDREFCASGWAAPHEGSIVPHRATDWFSEGLVPVLHEGGVAYANTSGEIVIEGDFTAAHPFADGRGRVRTSGSNYGFVDASGALIIPDNFLDAHDFSEGVAAVRVVDPESERRQWGFIDAEGQWVIKPQFNEAGPFSEGRAVVKTESGPRHDGYYPLAGFIDETGSPVIEPQFSDAEPFSEGLAAVRQSMRWGYVDASGTLAIEHVYREALPFSEDLAAVKDDDGWHFITSSGERAFDHPMLSEVIYLESFRNSLARAVFRLRDAGGYSSMGSGDLRVFSEAFYGYFDRGGKLVAVQSEEERHALLATILEAEALEEAEQREQEAFAAELRGEVLADCPDEIVYGNPDHPNVLEYGVAGKVRHLHFESILVEEESGGRRFKITVPRVLTEAPSAQGWINAHPAATGAALTSSWGAPNASLILALEPEATFSSSRLSTSLRTMPRLDCLQSVPGFDLGDLLDGWKSAISVAADSERQGTWLTVESGREGEDAFLRLAIASAPVQGLPTASQAAARFLDDDAIEAHAVIDSNLQVTYIAPQHRATPEGSISMQQPYALPFPAAGDRIARPAGQEMDVYAFVVREPDFLVIDHHRITPVEREDREDAIFDLRAVGLPQPLNQLQLNDETRQSRVVVTSVTHLAMPPLRVLREGASAPALALSLGGLPATIPTPALRPLQTQSTRVGLGETFMRITVRDTVVDGRSLHATTMIEEDASAFLVMAAESALSEQLGEDGIDALLRLFDEGQGHAEAWHERGDREGFITWIQPLIATLGVPTADLGDLENPDGAFMLLERHLGEATLSMVYLVAEARRAADFAPLRDTVDALTKVIYQEELDAEKLTEARRLLDELGLPYPESDDPDVFRDAAMEALFDAFGDAMMASDYRRMFSRNPDQILVLSDPATGRPVARLAQHYVDNEDLALDLEMRFGETATHLRASNVAQGDEEIELSTPSGLFDVVQFLTLIPYLDLTGGDRHELYLLDATPAMNISYTMEGSSRSVSVEPRPTYVTLTPAGKETLAVGDVEVPALRLEVAFTGAPPWPMGGRTADALPANPEGARVLDMVVSATAPHRVLLMTAGEHTVRFYPDSDARFPPRLATSWLVHFEELGR